MFHVPWFSHTGKIKSQNLFQKATTSFSSPLEQTPHFSRNPNFQSLKRFLKHCSQQREFRFPTQAWTIFLLILRNQTFPSLLPQLNRQSPKKPSSSLELAGGFWGEEEIEAATGFYHSILTWPSRFLSKDTSHSFPFIQFIPCSVPSFEINFKSCRSWPRKVGARRIGSRQTKPEKYQLPQKTWGVAVKLGCCFDSTENQGCKVCL